MSKIRKPAVAGMFYTSDPQKLKTEVETLLSISFPEENFKDIFGIVVPHAGYIYSGRTAAFGYNAIKEKKYKTVIIISPSHREYFQGTSIFNGEAYETPLGIVEVNQELADRIVQNSDTIFMGQEGHRDEHAIEVQLPFLQTIYEDFSIVPIVMGDQRKIFVDELSKAVADVADENTLVISSSDLSHYYAQETAERLDSIIEKDILDFAHDKLQNDLDNKMCEACGGGPIVAMMKAAWLKDYKHSIVFDRRDSSFASGDTSQVVGYLSAAVFKN